ncbi:MAG: biotin/lipoyl-binding protein [Porphyromonas sp.]|jgi:hlyD family secretion protein|nr:MAG: biotin/lipoyl-binding protein [Porphyromonas sp.]
MNTENNNTAQATNSTKSIILGIGIIAILMVLIASAGFIFFGEKEDIITGQVEVDEIRIAGKVPGRIAEFLVEEGQSVKEGDTLVRIYSPEVLAKLEQAEAAKAAAEAQNQKAIAGARKEQKEGAYELWQKAKAGLEVAEKSFARVEKLFKEGVVPAQKYDEVLAQLKAMQATERAARSQYDMAINGAQREDKMAAQALVARASGAISEVDAYMKESALLAPSAGTVSEIFPHKGELVGTGAPIMNIADYTATRVLCAVREDKLAKIKHGSKLKATVPALGDKAIELSVVKMKDMGSYATWKATKPRDEHDLRTFELTLKPTTSIEGLLPGMTVVLDKGQL